MIIMKKLFTIIFFLAFSITALAQDRPQQAPALDTITVEFQVLNISGDKAQIMSTQMNKKYDELRFLRN